MADCLFFYYELTLQKKMKIILVALVLVAVAVFLMALSILFKKNGKFPNSHIGGNKEMAKRGIYCATTTDKLERKDIRVIKPETLKLDGLDDESISC